VQWGGGSIILCVLPIGIGSDKMVCGSALRTGGGRARKGERSLITYPNNERERERETRVLFSLAGTNGTAG